MADAQVWFAYLTREGGYTLDARLEEVHRYSRELRRARVKLLGTYPTREAAAHVVAVNLRGRARFRMRPLKCGAPPELPAERVRPELAT